MTAWLLAEALPWLIGAGGTALAALALYWRGRTAQRDKTARAEADGYRKTRERIDDAEIPADDPGALRDWLRSRDPGKP